MNPLISTVTRPLHILLVWLLIAMPAYSHATGFELEDLEGNTHHLSDYRGKWVLVNFWATWCPPCLQEIPELSSLHSAHKDKDLVVIGIAMDSGSKFKVADFVQAHGISYPVVMGNRNIASQIGVVEALPTTYFYTPTGELAKIHSGEVTRQSVEKYMASKKRN